jgi:hypothetical protein
MALGVCIPDLIAQGKIPQDRAEQAQTLYDELVLQFEGRYGRAAAESMATTQALKAMQSDALHRKRQMLLTQKAQATMMDNARRRYDGGKGGDGPVSADAMVAHLARDERAPYANVEYRWHNVKQTALAMMHDLLAKHRADMIGRVRNKADFNNLVRELFGTKTGDLNAGELADSWRKASEYLRQRFNAAGGRIGKLEGWGLPQSHDGIKVGQVAPEAWIDDVFGRLDRDRMMDAETGLPFSDGKLRLVLREVYDTIVSDGWSNRNPGQMGGAATANRHAAHRFLHFKSADDWLAYNERFGGSDPFEAMQMHIDVMSRDIAMTEVLGPNPAATIQWMKDSIAKDAMLKGTLAQRTGLSSGEHAIDQMFRELTGEANRPVNRNLALFGSTLRNWQTSTKLGSAVISAFSDAATSAITRKFNGLPALDTISDIIKQMNPADPESAAFARRAGIISDEWIGSIGYHGRVHMDENFGGRIGEVGGLTRGLEAASEVTRRLADFTLRASGLNAWTASSRQAMGMEFMAAIAQFAGRDFDQLDAPFRGFLQRYGINRQDWDSIRSSPTTRWKGADWITPDSIENAAVRDRLMEGILTEVDFAVPTGGLRQRALVNSVPRGTVLGELIRTGFQFKMFPITVMAMQAQRAWALPGVQRKAGYAAGFVMGTSLMGALSVQVAEIVKGRDPFPVGSWDFVGRAMLKGGGLGIYGDLISQSSGEYGQDIGDVTKGPAYATGQNVVDLIRKRDVARFLKRETPGSSIWYVRAAYERLLVDTVGEMTDPDYGDRYADMLRRAEDEGTQYWLPPGEGVGAARAPDLGNVMASPPPEPVE